MLYPVSEAYKKAIAQNERNVRLVGTITLKDNTVIEIDDDDILQGSLYVSEQCVSGEDIEIGNVYASELGLVLTSPPANPYVLDGARIVLNFGIETSDGVWEYVPLGYFYVTDIERKYNAVSLKALDGMILLDIDLSGVLTTGTPYEIISSCCTKAGITLATSASEFNTFANGNRTFTLPPDSKVQTCRDVIMWLCQLMGAFARMNRLGQLEIVPIKASMDVRVIDRQQRFSTDVSDFVVKVTKVAMKVGNVDYAQGTDGVTMTLEENPFLLTMNEAEINTVLTNILNQVGTVEYTPCNVNFIGDPALQAGDWVKLTGVGLVQTEKDTVFLTGDFPAETDVPVAIALVTHSTWRYRGPHNIKAVGKSALVRGVQAQQTKSVSAVKTVAETAREIAQAANQSTQLIQDAITGYVLIRKNENTGSNEILIMDNPDPAQARKVWRWNMGGLGYSDNVVGVDNPDRVYTVAMTMDGAINADFVKTGKLIADVVQIGPTTTFAEGYDPSTKETPEGAQAKANTAEANAKAYAAQQASAAQTAAEDYADTILQQLANGQYTGGTFISGKSIISPVIAGLEGRFTGTVKIGDNGSIVIDGVNKRIYMDANNYWDSTGIHVPAANIVGKITASQLQVTSLSAISANLGTVTVGGSDNKNGLVRVLNSSGAEVVRLSNEGVTLSNGAKLIGDSGVLSVLTFQSDWQKAGWWEYGGMVENHRAHIWAFVPSNFVIVSATLVTKVMSRYLTGWGPLMGTPDGYYTIQSARIYHVKGSSQEGYYDWPAESEPTGATAMGMTDITDALWGGPWSPAAGTTIQMKSNDVKSYLSPGQRVVFAVDSGTTTDSGTGKNAAAVQFELTVIGYKQ